ncbi:MAG: DUF2520 domain-containing protein [Acidimicrobiia bacterium]|nr:DUF2520 domain-containing protein [Acidimicrobiia bacterium]
MKIAVYGPGRAGGALALAASRAGHQITGIDGRDPQAVAVLTDVVHPHGGTPELLIIAVSDDAIGAVASVLTTSARAVVHVSGAVPVDVLKPFADDGSLIGSFHPLQTFPNALVGADRLAGAAVAVTAEGELNATLFALAESLGCHPFAITDERKPLYHAAAAASANYTLATLAVASELYIAAGVDPGVAQPLVRAVVDNAFELGPDAALTGPIARGDVATVKAQIAAVRTAAPDMIDAFIDLGRITADIAGNADLFSEVFE